MKSKFLKAIYIVILLILFTFITAKSYAHSMFENLSENIFRLHIIANSDSSEDQTLKLKIRDNIIEYIKPLTSNLSNKKDVKEIIFDNINEIQKIAEDTVKANGFNYKVKTEIGNFYFPTKYYGNISLPAGYYDAIRIKIGNSEGQNWWCSLFPSLCFTDISSGVIDKSADENLQENLKNEEYELITTSNNTKIKFKIIEFFNKK